MTLYSLAPVGMGVTPSALHISFSVVQLKNRRLVYIASEGVLERGGFHSQLIELVVAS